MAKKVKIVGYAKREFFNNGIEYRNFSPDLVGNQLASDEGSPSFTFGNFNITSNLDGKVDKNFKTNSFSNFVTLDGLSIDEAFEAVINRYSKNAKLNLDYDDVLTYAYFGSLKEYIRVSLENIIIKWPASLYVSKIDPQNSTNTGDTVTNYSFNPLTNTSTFGVSTDRIQNPFSINILSGGTIDNTFNETNKLRNLVTSFSYYVVSNKYGDFKVTGFEGAGSLTSSSITLTVKGNPFPNAGSEIINYHIKPNELKREEFFFSLNEFEGKLLNRMAIPQYTASFKVTTESENGTTVEYVRKITWPIRDGYNIDFDSIEYSRYVNKLLEIAELGDDSKSNLMVRFLVSSSISEFDSIPDIDGTYQKTNGQKMTSALKIYGREFDEIKKYSDGIKFSNVVTYDKKNNTPDAVLKNLARVLGWQLTTSISDIDLVGNFLSLNKNYYDGYSRGLSDAEAELELWRRLILNTPWLWQSKGTRKAIEFLFRFIGAPKGLVSFNEYLYVAEQPVDVAVVTELMNRFNNTTDITDLNLDSNGFPFVRPNSAEMYFQKAGSWYRQTGGPNPDIDILEGNNPHIGPYDNGQAYINQFTQCLVPNFVRTEPEEIDIEAEINLFTNYGGGTFDECCDSDIYVDIPIPDDNYFQGVIDASQEQFSNNYPVNESSCSANTVNDWSIEIQLTGVTYYTADIIIGGDYYSYPTRNEFIDAVTSVSGSTGSQLEGVRFNITDDNIRLILTGGCDNILLDKYFKLEVCLSVDYDCFDIGVDNLVSFQVSNTLTDACLSESSSLTDVLYYTGGTSGVPEIGDIVYTDSLGVNVYVSPATDPRDLYLGGSTTDPNNYLRTNASGVREEIICPTTCNITLNREYASGSGVDETFSVDGILTGVTTTVKFRYTLKDVIVSGTNPQIGVEVGSLVLDYGTNQLVKEETRYITGVANAVDFSQDVVIQGVSPSVQYAVLRVEIIEVNTVSGEFQCIDGDSFIEYVLINSISL